MAYDSLRAELIGPFDVTYADDGIEAGYIALADLPAGTDVVKAWAEITAQWNSGGSNVMTIGVAKAGELTTFAVLASYDAKAAIASTSNARVEPTATASAGASVLQDSVLGIMVTEVGGVSSTGAAKVYALIVTPDNEGA